MADFLCFFLIWMKLCLDKESLAYSIDTFELLCQGFLAQPGKNSFLALPVLWPGLPSQVLTFTYNSWASYSAWRKMKRFHTKTSAPFFQCVHRHHWGSCSSSFRLCLSLQPFSSPSSSSEGLPFETSPQHNVTLVPVSRTFSGNSHYFFYTCKHTMCLLPYLKKNKKQPIKPKPTKPPSTWISLKHLSLSPL